MVREDLTEKVTLEYRCKRGKKVNPVHPELGESEMEGKASAKALRWGTPGM